MNLYLLYYEDSRQMSGK